MLMSSVKRFHSVRAAHLADRASPEGGHARLVATALRDLPESHNGKFSVSQDPAAAGSAQTQGAPPHQVAFQAVTPVPHPPHQVAFEVVTRRTRCAPTGVTASALRKAS